MLIENKRIFLYHKDRNSNKFSFYDTEKSVFKDIELTSDNYDVFVQTLRDDSKAFCGYGNAIYEDIIINELIYKPELFKEMSTSMLVAFFKQRDELLHQEWTGELQQLKRMNLFYHFDLSVLLFSKNVRPDLDDLRYSLPIDANLRPIEIIKFIFDHNIDYINERLNIESKFDIDLINCPAVDIGMFIARKQYCKQCNIQWKDLMTKRSECGKIKLSDCIDLSKYNLEQFPTIKTYLETEVFIPGYNTIDIDFLFQNIKCKFSLGGIKALGDKGFYQSNEQEVILYLDAKSFYPSIFIGQRIYPQHLNNGIVDIMSDMFSYRFEHGSIQMKTAMNSMIGKMMIDSWIYDPFKHTQLVLTGNLIILDVLSTIDSFNGQILQINNDGIFLKVSRDKAHILLKQIDMISIKYNICFKSSIIDKLLLHSITNYICTDAIINYEANRKTIKSGIFDTEDFNYGRIKPANIISDAVYEYFFNHITIADYIKSHKKASIYCFTEFIKAPEGYVLYNGDVFTKARIYYSTNGKNIFKAKQDINNLTISSKLNKNQTGVNIYNKSSDNTNCEDIDYQYYINEAYKIINEIEHKQLTLF